VSSHALAQERVAGVHFKVGGFTQLGRDHLDYHETMDAYFEAKARLFSEGLGKSRARGRMAVINVDDPRGRELLERCQGWGVKVLGVSSGEDPEAEVTVLEADYGLDGTRARIRTSKGEWDIRTRLVGPHNLANVCVAVGMALAMGFAKARIAPGLEALERVPGRLERIPDENGRVVFVDYAHTPDALAQTLDALRPHVEGRLWIVFGAGGDRDADKRGPMGEAAGRRVDGAIVTSDNPRGEAPDAIAAQLAAGLEQAGLQRGEDGVPGPGTFVLELDRQAAIHAAVGALEPQDVLLIAGKGSETVQVLEDRRYLFDDREVARRALEGAAPLELELAPAPEPAFTAPRAVTEQVDVEDVLDETLEVEEGSIEATEADEKGSEET
jgi:UDP-N-acetylmuramyl-tripeptide synthetase